MCGPYSVLKKRTHYRKRHFLVHKQAFFSCFINKKALSRHKRHPHSEGSWKWRKRHFSLRKSAFSSKKELWSVGKSSISSYKRHDPVISETGIWKRRKVHFTRLILVYFSCFGNKKALSRAKRAFYPQNKSFGSTEKSRLKKAYFTSFRNKNRHFSFLRSNKTF